jgi:acyl-CoA synthetase (AMP-forming)/AMP-acid ligase II
MADTTSAGRFAAAGRSSPDAIAVRYNAVSLTYRELAGQAGGLALALREQGVRPGDVVATVVDRSPMSVVAMVAIWATGATHAPLDPADPDSRIMRTLSTHRARVVLTDRTNASRVPGSLVLDELPVAPYEPVVSERGAVSDHLTTWYGPIPDIVASTIDAGNACALLTGGTLDLLDRATALNPAAFAARLRAHPPGMLACTPSELYDLIHFGESADLLSTGLLLLDGEPLPTDLARTVLAARPNLAVIPLAGVETAEIEDVLLAERGIREAVVTTEQISRDQPAELVAYLVGLAEHAKLLHKLRQRLPASHIPKRLRQVVRIPLTRDGDTNLAALRKLAGRKPIAPQPPRTETERIIADIWCEVLKHIQIGRHAKFSDLGGNPARSRAVVRKLRRHFPELTIAQLATHPTVAELAAALDADAGPDSTTVVRV